MFGVVFEHGMHNAISAFKVVLIYRGTFSRMLPLLTKCFGVVGWFYGNIVVVIFCWSIGKCVVFGNRPCVCVSASHVWYTRVGVWVSVHVRLSVCMSGRLPALSVSLSVC